MIAIIKYNAGNITSVENALRRLGQEVILTSDPAVLRAAEKVIFPGVGSAAPAMAYLRQRGLDHIIKSLSQPLLGICLGMQLMCRHSEEGDTPGLGIFDVDVARLPQFAPVPHTGWNALTDITGPLFEDLQEWDDFYFVHSYYVGICQSTIATTNYMLPISAALQKNNFYATQFHPEKSGNKGEQILKNFLSL